MKILGLGERLVRSGVITPEQLQIVLAEQKRFDRRFGDLALELGFATPEQVAIVVAEMSGVRYEQLAGRTPDPALAQLVPEQVARRHHLVPLARNDSSLVVVMANPLDVQAVDRLRAQTGLDIEVAVSSDKQISDAQDALYIDDQGAVRLDQAIDLARKAVDGEKDRGERELAPIIELVEGLLIEGFRRRATDVHLEPEERVVRVRYRVDGVLLPGPTLPMDLKSTVTARMKILSDLDISESRLPQDGRIRMTLGRRVYDLRVSTIPTVHGENIVLRVLDKSNVIKGLEAIGMSARDLEMFTTLIATQAGMILVTGPTGSGKTTTLYSALASLDASRTKIATLEDPVEYELPMVRQSQVNEKAGFGFAEGLRALLRQDPDTIFVGEMRDAETSGIAVRAAMTGHLVMSTLHTTSALGTLPRLVQMGIPPDLLLTSIRGLMAQRLVRLVCVSCTEEHEPDPALVHRLGLSDLSGATFRRGAGCPQCSGTGYRGRTGLYEVVRMTPELGDAFASGASATAMARIACRDGTRFLRDHGLEQAFAGITTLDEVLRATADAPASGREVDALDTADVLEGAAAHA
ncbi:MAG: Flp pilus assembly complex ATPase component [bacterium]|nr:Flp pilus assembly complex ATPase component [bacterium]